MKFALVNGRTPSRQSRCARCGELIRAGYLREIGTHLIYCDHNCYADHCQSTFKLLEEHAAASCAAFTFGDGAIHR